MRNTQDVEAKQTRQNLNKNTARRTTITRKRESPSQALSGKIPPCGQETPPHTPTRPHAHTHTHTHTYKHTHTQRETHTHTGRHSPPETHRRRAGSSSCSPSPEARACRRPPRPPPAQHAMITCATWRLGWRGLLTCAPSSPHTATTCQGPGGVGGRSTSRSVGA